MKVKKSKNKTINIANITKPIVKATSLWRVFVSFAITSLIIVNIINFWQPVNHNNLKSIYEYQQKTILSAYELRDSYNNFKYHPDQTAFSLIQKMVIFNNHVNGLKQVASDFNIDLMEKLNANIEKITSEIPSIKLFQENIDKLYRAIKKIKYDIISNINTSSNENGHKSLYPTAVKIEELLQQFKFDNWSNNININGIQDNIENLSLDIEQIKINQLEEESNYNAIITSIQDVFNEITLLMPAILKLSLVNTELLAADKNQDQLVKSISDYKINYMDNINDQNIIIFTIIMSNLLLFIIVLLAKTSEKTKTIYSNYKAKQDIYFLSHDTIEKNNVNPIKQPYNNISVYNDDKATNDSQVEHNNKRLRQLLVERANDKLILEQIRDKKQNLITNCYTLLNVVDQVKSNLKQDENVSSYSMVTISKIAFQIMDQALLLEKNINKLEYKSRETSESTTEEILD